MPSPLGPATKLNLETIMAPRVLVVGDCSSKDIKDGQLRPKEEDQNDDDDDDEKVEEEKEEEEEEEGGTVQ
ncbi:hypothetical protein HZH68_006078 [Vespula germanica]|uniref:Uncharacterized protein n=1 Tax=Vespula germanica TaxID=30212 RepID=A0A834KA57_VESGE|nr:hypothetical protein HZH68_006078 [Vespula germanica]